MVILDVMDDHNLASERYPENFVLISQLEVFQEGGVKKGGTCQSKNYKFSIPNLILEVEANYLIIN